MISKKTIDQVFQTARVEEVVGDFVALKKSGSNFKGLSPLKFAPDFFNVTKSPTTSSTLAVWNT